MWNRRQFVAGAVAAGLGVAAASPWGPARAKTAPVAQLQVPENFHHQDWFQKTSFDLRGDLAAAAKSGKMLVTIWEQVGCTYCQQMHEVAFQRDDIVSIAKANFHVIQMDMHGDRQFKGFDGKMVSESDLASELQVRNTPTTQFFDAAGGEVFRMPGYAAPPLFRAVYRYVVAKGYETASLGAWIKQNGI